ncbi:MULTISPECIES: hypothetical protein [unclassified Chelatococcus]|jgi:hypothetical protein|uniref:hypothetical protein n=1 Tax=unclassified Chelatococcus TaxID=2638111 RepID=UPI001BCEB96B|nr:MULTISPECIES: hypothetical protein [unclassified Chelatococcus]MBS7740661.1 hypothetical protein [Chelatococcus sp. HY11]MBX3544555.1 hypothetical protein [Chelatococcus sp.]CAH1657296.1 hypothetical protein CHELA41_21378 [Hyphomicrobiales bacterium]
MPEMTRNPRAEQTTPAPRSVHLTPSFAAGKQLTGHWSARCPRILLGGPAGRSFRQNYMALSVTGLFFG